MLGSSIEPDGLDFMPVEKPMTDFQVEALVTLSKFNSLSASKLSIARSESRRIKQQLKDVLVKESFIYDSLAKFAEDMTVEREIIKMSINNFQNHISTIQPKGEQAKKTLKKLHDEAQDINEFLAIFSTKMTKEKMELDAVFSSYKLELQAILDSASGGSSPSLRLAHSPYRGAESLDVLGDSAVMSFDHGNAEAKLSDSINDDNNDNTTNGGSTANANGNDYDEYGIAIPLIVLNSPQRSVTLTSYSSSPGGKVSPAKVGYSVGDITKSNDIHMKYWALYSFTKKLNVEYKLLKAQFRAELASVFGDLSDLKHDVASVVSTIVKKNEKMMRAKVLECRELVATNKSLEQSLRDLRKRHDDLVAMYQELEVKYNGVVEDNGKNFENIAELNDSVANLNRTIASISTQRDDLIIKVGAKGDEVEKCKLDIMHLNTDMSSLNKMLSTVQQQKDHMEKNLHSKSDDYEKANIAIHELETRVRELTRDNNTKIAQKDDVEKRLHDKADELDSAKMEISDLNMKISDLKRGMMSLSAAKEDIEKKEGSKTDELDKSEKTINGLRSTIDDLNRAVTSSNSQNSDLESKLNIKSAELEKSKVNITQLTSEVANLSQRITGATHEKEHVAKSLQDRDLALEAANKTIFEMKSALSDFTRGNQTSVTQMEDLERKLQAKSEECEKAKIDISDLSTKVIDLGRSITTVTTTKEELEKKYASLDEQFKVKVSQNEKNNFDILQLKSSDNERLKSISELQARLQNLVENQTKSSEKSPKEYEKDIAELTKTVAAMKEELNEKNLSNKDLLIRVHNLDAEWHKALNKVHVLEAAQKDLHAEHAKRSKDHHEKLQRTQSEHGELSGELDRKHAELEAKSTALLEEKTKMTDELASLHKKLGDMQTLDESKSLKLQEASNALQETNKKLIFEIDSLRASSSESLAKKIDEFQAKEAEVQNLQRLNAALLEKLKESDKQRDVSINNCKEDLKSMAAQVKASEDNEAAKDAQISDLKKTIKNCNSRLVTKEEELDILLQELKKNESLVQQLSSKIREKEGSGSQMKSSKKKMAPHEDPDPMSATPVAQNRRGPTSQAQSLAVSPLTEELMHLSDNIAPPAAPSTTVGMSPRTPKGKTLGGGVEDASPSRLVSPGSGEFKYANKIRQSVDFNPTEDR